MFVAPPTKIRCPSWISSGASAGVTSGSTPSYPSSPVAGDLFVLQLMTRGTETGAPTTPTGFTLRYGPDAFNVARGRIYTARSDGTETGTLTVSGVAAPGGFAIIHLIRGVRLSDFLDTSAASVTGSAVNTSTINDADVTTTGPGRLVLNCLGFEDTTPAFAAFSGMAGGTWVQATNWTQTAGVDTSGQLQYAQLPDASNIHNGSFNASPFSGNYVNHGFSLIGI